jgi:hypothetical protein
MKHLFFTLLLATLCAANGYGQTIKSLGFNTTNGQVVANTTNVLTFSNALAFGANASTTLNNLGASTGVPDFVTAAEEIPAATALALAGPVEGALVNVFGWTGVGTNWYVDLFYRGPIRSALGLPLAALTNTSNVTAMRALSGSTNTNHPFSGSVSVVGTNNTNTLVFSNGILQAVQ